MASQHEKLSFLHLRSDEVEELPARLKERFGARFESADEWILLGTADRQLARLADHVIRVLAMKGAESARSLSERNIEQLVDFLLSRAPHADVETDLEIDNVQLRADYLEKTPVLTAAEVRAASDLRPRNKSEPASRWKREGRIFAVRCQGIDRYPRVSIPGRGAASRDQGHTRRPPQRDDGMADGAVVRLRKWLARRRRTAAATG